MSKKTYEESNIQAIANAIRAKNGSQSQYTPGQMAEAIASIVTNPRLQSKTITPGASQQTVQADNGYDGLSSVVINGDNELVAENIKTGVEIFGVTGSYAGSGGVTPTGTIIITQNGIVDVTNYANADIRVPSGGGGSVFAFVECVYRQGEIITATDGTTTLTSDTSGNFIFAIPNAGTWVFSDSLSSVSVIISEYGFRTQIGIGFLAFHIWTFSTSGTDAIMAIQYGTYGSSIFTPIGEVEYVHHNDVWPPKPEKNCYDLASLSYPSKWKLTASKVVSDGANTYNPGDEIKNWAYDHNVDLVIYEP